MDILVTGGSGKVGWKILDRANPQDTIWYTYRNSDVEHPEATGYRLDIRNEDEVSELIFDVEPDSVIHSAAMTNVDGCEKNPETAYEINVDGTGNVGATATKADTHMVDISTSFVFDGTKHPHEEDDEKKPVNEYGRTKALAEEVVEAADIPSAIVRTDQPYGWTETWQNVTMVEWVLDELNRDGNIEVFDDWYNVPTYLPDLAKAILKITKTGKEEIYHAVGPDFLNRYEWSCEIADAFGYDVSRIEPVPSDTVDLPAERPNAYIRNNSVTDVTGKKFSSIRAGLKQMARVENEASSD
jgi:dTDP-4-dehydrorhamnose reductase